MGLNIIYENEHFAVIDKEAGVLSEGSPDSVLSQFEQYLITKYPNKKQLVAGLPHRLDKPVSGLIICTKKRQILKDWSGQSVSPWTKIYWALVKGKFEGPKECKHFIGRLPNSIKAQVSNIKKDGFKLALLNITQLEYKNGYSLLEIELKTGRYHQIRAQLAYIGYPIVGDTLYASEKGTIPSSIQLVSKRILIKSNKYCENLILESQKLLKI